MRQVNLRTETLDRPRVSVFVNTREFQKVESLAAPLTEQEALHVKRLVEVTERGEQVFVRQHARLVVGQVSLRGTTLVVPPPFDPGIFLQMFVLGHTPDYLSQTRFVEEVETLSALSPGGPAEYFRVLLSVLYLRWVESVVSSHIAQSYERQFARLRTLRGRIVWSRALGRHPVDGMPCSFFRLETDNALNQVVLLGVIRAADNLRGTEWDGRAQRQLFVWRELATPVHPEPRLFASARSKISRLTQHYLPVLRLAETLIYGHSPQDIPSVGSEGLQGFYIHADRVYEAFLGELVSGVLTSHEVVVEKQFRIADAFVDLLDRRYAHAKPDLVVLRRGLPVAMLDAKYKPHYVSGGPAQRAAQRNRVSSEDLYQMFFYELTLRHRYHLDGNVPAAIVAPIIGAERPVDRASRIIKTQSADGIQARVEVIALPLEAVVREAAKGDLKGALRLAPELETFLAQATKASILT